MPSKWPSKLTYNDVLDGQGRSAHSPLTGQGTAIPIPV
jgi:hypothetical protein